jgi:hypothetical protein
MIDSDFAADHGFDRRTTDRLRHDSRARQEIINQMSEIEDPTYRVMLGLLIKMQDETVTELGTLQLMMQGYMSKIAHQLEKISKTDDDIRKAALNGHHGVHDDHHKWIESQMRQDEACNLVLHKHGEDGLCEMARQAVKDRDVAERRKWKIMDGLAEKMTWAIFLLIVGAVTSKYLPGA